MARGRPDYGNDSFITALPDTSNDAVISAIYGFAPMDTRGRIVILETFGHGVNAWGQTVHNGGSYPVLQSSVQSTYASDASLDMLPNVNGGDTSIFRDIRLVDVEKVGIESAFLVLNSTGIIEMSMEISANDGRIYTGRIKYSPTEGKFYIQNQLANDVALSDPITGVVSLSTWIPFKMVINMATKKYDRLVFGHKSYDISATSLYNVAGGDGTRCYFALTVRGTALGTGRAYLGYTIVTRDEP